MYGQVSVKGVAERVALDLGGDMVDGVMVFAVRDGNVATYTGGLPNLQISEATGKMLHAIAEAASLLSAEEATRIRRTYREDIIEDMRQRSEDNETGTQGDQDQ